MVGDFAASGAASSCGRGGRSRSGRLCRRQWERAWEDRRCARSGRCGSLRCDSGGGVGRGCDAGGSGLNTAPEVARGRRRAALRRRQAGRPALGAAPGGGRIPVPGATATGGRGAALRRDAAGGRGAAPGATVARGCAAVLGAARTGGCAVAQGAAATRGPGRWGQPRRAGSVPKSTRCGGRRSRRASGGRRSGQWCGAPGAALGEPSGRFVGAALGAGSAGRWELRLVLWRASSVAERSEPPAASHSEQRLGSRTAASKASTGSSARGAGRRRQWRGIWSSARGARRRPWPRSTRSQAGGAAAMPVARHWGQVAARL